MKKTLFALILTLVSSVAASADPAGTHGMLVMGKDRIFLSHLPMFMPLHAYQAIFEAEFSSEGKDIYQANLAAFPEERVYTINPEPFVLPKMIEKARMGVGSFKAELYRGHFERGGVMIAPEITIKVKLVYAEAFQKDATHPKQLEYFAFGQKGGQQFIAHVIKARPDFDQIMETTGMDSQLGKVFVIEGAPARKPLPESATRRELYLEFGDLE